MDISRLKNRAIARLITYFPSIAKKLVNSYTPWESENSPWTPVKKLLRDSRVAVVTTAGVHHTDQNPFNMYDKDGDPAFRVIDAIRPLSDLMITHDYYDHSDADKDINIVFPINILKEFEREGIIGSVADRHYGLMGHITGRHIHTLINVTARKVTNILKSDGVDIALLTPG
ncbi:D-proline reductase subunit gamma [bacterium BMS3Abin07]|nr:D-proline reductase subunit gamma [bacterium BMS3Abin07]GBE33392.1 D-proline reductase subunit gamma [bacterium BMS3Bbin05]